MKIPRFPKIYIDFKEVDKQSDLIEYKMDIATIVRVKDKDNIWREIEVSDYSSKLNCPHIQKEITSFYLKFINVVYNTTNLYISSERDKRCPLQLEEKDRAMILHYLSNNELITNLI